jgi:hypothetical protein
MAIKDLKSTIDLVLNATVAVSATGSEDGGAVDTSNFLTLTFGLDCTAYTDGTHTLSLLESDDNGVTDAYAAVPAAALIGSYPSITAATADGASMGTVGLFSNKKWVKPVIVSTGVTTGATIEIVQINGLERMHS